jgi:glycine/D-amino acid oxidase-like deaminating enzyme
LSAHADELGRALASATRSAGKRRLLGRDRAAVWFSQRGKEAERDAWVVAVEARGKTIVASAVVVAGSPNDAVMTAMLKGLEVK